MSERILLGIDCGGTHTDAVILSDQNGTIRTQASAKVPTNHADLPKSIHAVLSEIANNPNAAALFPKITNVTLGTTLAVNALVQGTTEKVGLILSAGPGISPKRFVIGDYYHICEGGLNHRGIEVTPLETKSLDAPLNTWKKKGIHRVACVSKFSPRNPSHEIRLGKQCEDAGMKVTLGHSLSGELNFPRRIATAYYNCAVATLHNRFIDAVEEALSHFSIKAHVRFLKADGGAIALELSRTEPVQSILSGPAASVMGVLALAQVEKGVSLLLDIGGTTTDMALIVDGSPVIDRFGMEIQGRRTLVRTLAQTSIGVGGDSLIQINNGTVTTGPMRIGNAMAYGGKNPTLLDALNFANFALPKESGDRNASKEGILSLAQKHNLDPKTLAEQAIHHALDHIHTEANALLAHINAHPIYTLQALRTYSQIQPEQILLVGGPAKCLEKRLEKEFSIPVRIPEHFDCANAVGAALTRPTESLEIYADSAKRTLLCPKLDHTETLRQVTVDAVSKQALLLLQQYLAKNSIEDAQVEVISKDIIAVLDDYGSSSRDIRVTCQAVPGIFGKVSCK